VRIEFRKLNISVPIKRRGKTSGYKFDATGHTISYFIDGFIPEAGF